MKEYIFEFMLSNVQFLSEDIRENTCCVHRPAAAAMFVLKHGYAQRKKGQWTVNKTNAKILYGRMKLSSLGPIVNWRVLNICQLHLVSLACYNIILTLLLKNFMDNCAHGLVASQLVHLHTPFAKKTIRNHSSESHCKIRYIFICAQVVILIIIIINLMDLTNMV